MKLKVFLFVIIAAIIGLSINNVYASKQKSKVYYKDKVMVLMYHHIDAKEGGVTISPARFGTHMKLLHNHGYNVITVEEFAQFMKGEVKVPENAVVITFDDGYDSYRQYAVPIMNKYDMVGTHFIIGASSDLHNVETAHLTWDAMRDLKEQGHSFYSHTYDLHYYQPLDKDGAKTGPMLTNRLYSAEKGRVETEEEYIERITADVEQIESTLKRELNNEQQMIAYPYGAYNDTAKKVLKDAGVTLFFTIKPGINSPGSDEVFRINAGTPTLTANKFLARLAEFHTK